MATRVRVLAAELSTPQRFTRGREYAESGAVVDIDVGAGCATASVRGSRVRPYQVDLEVRPGDGPPTRHDLDITCTCPDSTDAPGDACKHAVAALIVLADEIAINPDTLGRWRVAVSATTAPEPIASTRSAIEGASTLAAALRCPESAVMPEIGPLLPAPPCAVSDPELAAMLAGALEVICDDGTHSGASLRAPQASSPPDADTIAAD